MKEPSTIFEQLQAATDINEKRALLKEISENDTYKQYFIENKKLVAFASTSFELTDNELEVFYREFKNILAKQNKKKQFRLRLLKYAAVITLVASSSYITLQFTDLSVNQADLATTIISENGQQSRVVLPDGSVVKLNYGSKLTYNNNYGVSNRTVDLEGEAFFEVVKNKNSRFIVRTNQFDVKVYGTSFNVEAYTDNTTARVYLQNGSVEMAYGFNKDKTQQLKPGELAVYNFNTKQLALTETKNQKALAWINGLTYFNDTPMKEVLNKLERKYNIDIQVINPKVYTTVFTATLKSESVKEVFKLIDYSCLLHCKIVQTPDLNKRTRVIIDIR